MERLELSEKGLSELRAKPWLTVGSCSVACEWPTQHLRCGPRGVLTLYILRPLVNHLWISCGHPVEDISYQFSICDC